jgi:hypothetical protein
MMTFPSFLHSYLSTTGQADDSDQVNDKQDTVEGGESASTLGFSMGLADDQILMRSWMMKKWEKGPVPPKLKGLRKVYQLCRSS